MRILTFCILTSFLVFLTVKTYASGTPLARAEISSKEIHQITGSFSLALKFDINEDFIIQGEPQYTLPAGWSGGCTDVLKGKKCEKIKPFGLVVQLAYPAVSLPFYPQTISVSIAVTSVKDTAVKEIIVSKGKVYFTPYNTVEIWRLADFHNMDRVWLAEGSNIDTTRKYISKNSIPASNIPHNYIMKETWEDDFKLVRVEGLAYSIPMLAIHPDSFALYNNEDLPTGINPDSLFQEEPSSNEISTQALIRPTRIFRGIIQGRLVTTIINDLGDPVVIPLAGVNVLLKEYDWYANENFGETYTDDNGNFTFTYFREQTFAEGRNIELFLKYKTRNGQFDIKVKPSAIFGGTYEEHSWLGDQGQLINNNYGDINISNDAFKPLHWAFRAWRFSVNNGVALIPDLTILPFANESYFLPDGISGWTSPINRPTIRLESIDCIHENIIYHEFGHFFQWNIQLRNFTIPIAADKSGDHDWPFENTSRFAWIEGWGDAFQMIVDAAYRAEDGEYGFDEQSFRLGNGAEFESRIPHPTTSINRGFESEYYIACAIYDLWDGPNKGLPVEIPGTRIPGTTGPGTHGFNDRLSANWLTDDDIMI
jgi:hypothetical protein